jgi:hypothetical protein
MQHQKQRRHASWHQRTLARRERGRKAHTYRGWEHWKETDIRAATTSGRGSIRYRSRAHTRLGGVAERQSLRHSHHIRSPSIASMRITNLNAETRLDMHKHKAIITSKTHISKEKRVQSRKWRWSSRHYKLEVARGNMTGPDTI